MGSHFGIVANVLNCDIIVSKFKCQLHYYIHIQTNTLGEKYEPNPFICPAMD